MAKLDLRSTKLFSGKVLLGYFEQDCNKETVARQAGQRNEIEWMGPKLPKQLKK